MLQARGAAAAAIATAAGFPFMGQILRRFWSPDTEDAMMRYLTVLARTVVETYIDKSSFPSCASDLAPCPAAQCHALTCARVYTHAELLCAQYGLSRKQFITVRACCTAWRKQAIARRVFDAGMTRCAHPSSSRSTRAPSAGW